MTERAYWRWQIFGVILLACIFAVPHLRHIFGDPPGSLLPIVSTNDGLYLSHVRAALLGRFAEAGNGMIAGVEGAAVPGGGMPAALELIVGMIFRSTGLHASWVIMLLTIFLTPLVLFPLTGVLRAATGEKKFAFIGSFLYIFIFLSALQKPINLSLSFPIAMGTLWLVIRVWEHPSRVAAIVAGVFLGLLPWTYFWAWTYVWAVTGWMAVLWLLRTQGWVLLKIKKDNNDYQEQPPQGSQRTVPGCGISRAFFFMGIAALLTALPYFFNLWSASQVPFFQETTVRSTIIHSRGVESLPRSLLLTILMLSTFVFVHFSKKKHNFQEQPPQGSPQRPSPAAVFGPQWILPLSAVLAAFSVMHQNLLHGVIFTFSSHYYPFVCLSALMAALWVIRERVTLSSSKGDTRVMVRRAHHDTLGLFFGGMILLSTSIFLLAAFWDYRARWDIFQGTYYVRDLQHLGPAVQMLEKGGPAYAREATAGKREVVLTDMTSAYMVTLWSDDDVIFTDAVRHILISDDEFAERYCLAEIFQPGGPDLQWLVESVVERPSEEEYAARRAQFMTPCGRVRKDPASYLKKYNVTKLLWNERLRPEWKIDEKLFMKVESGEGWSLWSKKDSW